jgi:hypothetical protein
MPLPEVRPGLVIRYDYLRQREATAERNQGKDRPCCLVAVMKSITSARFVGIRPITHTPPDSATVGIEIPARVREALGMDGAPGWIIVSEHNVDEWPNASLAPLPGRPGTFSFSFIPSQLSSRVKEEFLALYDAGIALRCADDDMQPNSYECGINHAPDQTVMKP